MPNPVSAKKGETPDFWWIGLEDSPVLVENAEAVMPYLPYYLAGWPLKWAATGDDRKPDIQVVENSDGTFRVISSGLGAASLAFDNPYDAANGLSGELVSTYVSRAPQTVCLHAGAARVGDGLVVVIGDRFVGKSSVAIHLAVLGNRFFGDDQIALKLENPYSGMCLGLMPKVRLPLPDDCGDPFREFVDGYTSMRGDAMAYLKLWEGEASTFGETAPVRAIVFLVRTETGKSSLRPGSRPELLKAMVRTAFAPHISSLQLLSSMTRFVDSTDTYHLRFSSSRDAAVLLSRELRHLDEAAEK